MALTFDIRGGHCLSKDVPTLPTTGDNVYNGQEVYVIDPPDGTNATSKLYKFDSEGKKWWPQ